MFHSFNYIYIAPKQTSALSIEYKIETGLFNSLKISFFTFVALKVHERKIWLAKKSARLTGQEI